MGSLQVFYIFLFNAYVKKFRSNKKGAYLVSLNKEYAPMPITENSSFKSFGRVRYLVLYPWGFVNNTLIISKITLTITKIYKLTLLTNSINSLPNLKRIIIKPNITYDNI